MSNLRYSIIAEPLDTLFFRDSSPFNAGESPYLTSLFPPTPHTGYGFSRAVILDLFCKNLWSYIRKGCKKCKAKGDCPVCEAVGNPSRRDGTLKLKGPYIYNHERLFALPRDLTSPVNAEQAEYLQPSCVPDEAIRTDLGKIRLPSAVEKHRFLDEIDDYLISESSLIAYLQNELVKYKDIRRTRTKHLDSQPLVYGERHTGISMDHVSRTSLEEHLYTIELLRLNDDIAIWTGIEGFSEPLEFPTTKMTARIGGEGKRTAVEIGKGQTLPDVGLDDKISETGRLKLLLLQHADFDGNWYPIGFEKSEDDGVACLMGSINGVEMKLVSAMIGKPIYIGGWDIAENKPRSLKPLVPSGSVFYMEIDDNQSAEAVDAIHDKHIGLKTNLGFGHTAIGVWSNE